MGAYTPEIAVPRGYARGEDRQAGGATPLGAAAGLVAGVSTPISNQMDPEVEAEIRARYYRLLTEIQVEEQRMQRETVETYGTLSGQLLAANANLVAAVAEGAKAKAMSDEAVAKALGVGDGMLDMAADLRFFEPDADAWDAYTAEADLTAGAVQRVLSQYGTGVTPDFTDDQAYAKYEEVLNGTQINLTNRHVGKLVEIANGLDSTNPKRTTTVVQGTGQIESEVRTAIATMAAKDGRQLTEDELEDFTQRFMERNVHPTVFGSVDPDTGDMSGGLLTTEDMAQYEQKRVEAAEVIEEYNQRIDEMGAGLDPSIVNDARYALAHAQEVLAGGPHAFADMVSTMPTPQGTTFTKQAILNEIAKLDQGDIDPLNAARKEILAVPGFDVWMQAMGFHSVTRAMLYAGNHPYEFKEAVKGYVQAQNGTGPSSVATPHGMRAYLKQKGDEEGIGFQVTPLGRAVARFTGRRNLGFDLSDRLQGVRQRLEAMEPKTRLGEGFRDRLLQGLGPSSALPEGRRLPSQFEEGFDPEGLEGQDAIDVIEEDVKFQEDMAKARQEQKAVEDPGFRDVEGAGLYTYRQYADGRLQIIERPNDDGVKETLTTPIDVPLGGEGTAYKAIVDQIGIYEPPAGAEPTADASPEVDPETGFLKGADSIEGDALSREMEKMDAAEEVGGVDPYSVSLPPKKEGDYDLVQLDESEGGWVQRHYDDGSIEIVKAPGFEDMEGQVFDEGTYQHQSLKASKKNARVTTRVGAARDPLTEDISFEAVDPGEITQGKPPPKTKKSPAQPTGKTRTYAAKIQEGSTATGAIPIDPNDPTIFGDRQPGKRTDRYRAPTNAKPAKNEEQAAAPVTNGNQVVSRGYPGDTAYMNVPGADPRSKVYYQG